MNKKISEFKKQLIMDAANKYFRADGYSGVQIDKIAKELEIGVGTIYSIFGSKEGLFVNWLFSVVNKVYKEINEEFKKQTNPILQCEIFVNFKLAYYEKNKSVFKDYIKNNPYFLKDATRGTENPMRKIYLLISKTIENLIEKENKVMNRDSYHLAYLLDGITDSYIEYYSEKEDVMLESKTREVIRMFLNAIGMSEYEYQV